MGFSGAKIAPCPPYTPLGTIESSKGLRPSRALPSFLTVWAPLKGELSLKATERLAAPDALSPAVTPPAKEIQETLPPESLLKSAY